MKYVAALMLSCFAGPLCGACNKASTPPETVDVTDTLAVGGEAGAEVDSSVAQDTAANADLSPIDATHTEMNTEVDADSPPEIVLDAEDDLGTQLDDVIVDAQFDALDLETNDIFNDADETASEVANGDSNSNGVPVEQTPTGICDDGLQLPHAGSPCTDEAAVHCSRVGEGSKLLFYGNDGPYTICERPYQVICAKTSTGALTWQVSACPPATDTCKDVGLNLQTCQENSHGAHCCPEAVTGLGSYAMCKSQEVGKKWCEFSTPTPGQDGIGTCAFPDVVLKDVWSEMYKNQAFAAACAKSCKDCTYFFVDACPKIYWAKCMGCMKAECKESGEYCMTNLPNKPNPSCVENCEEFKFTKDYKPK